jgi:hypothetical protein
VYDNVLQRQQMSKRNRSVRVPDDLYATIARLAEREDRTVSNMIIVLLKEAIVTRQEPKKENDKK